MGVSNKHLTFLGHKQIDLFIGNLRDLLRLRARPRRVEARAGRGGRLPGPARARNPHARGHGVGGGWAGAASSLEQQMVNGKTEFSVYIIIMS